MRILVTGGSGQLGSEWVQYLNRQEVEFISLSSYDFDLTDHADTRRVMGNLKPDVLINCAAYTKVDQAEEEPEKAFAINGEGVANLAGYCAEHDIKLVHFSTDYVFPGTKEDGEKLPGGYPEDHPTNPINVYGESKLAGEKALKESGCSYLLCRVSWLCGRYGNNFVKTMLKLGHERDLLKVVNDQHGCPTFTKNAVDLCWKLILQEEEGTFHLSSKGKISWYDFANEIFKQADVKVHVEPVDSSEFASAAKRPAFSLLSTQKIANISGAEVIGWKEGLKNLLSELNT
ncbi:dTDP-4-dehydrorhamnose reductase [Gracilimonas mengyeensis]|uniref:dTDP-4-dehydrorhamnose reductase n=1 Tax=Gracilimonas mengyeensis TaxID=1302730 RepID=A0A521EPH1_9BACT|nr:dTDP-4-dehydrorhamnose reductase [Gracilimonas mengyeensis]SMO85816.1 dTDP-4-dehydrorhamnose reductase [Gracilimonas mengyeensis]